MNVRMVAASAFVAILAGASIGSFLLYQEERAVPSHGTFPTQGDSSAELLQDRDLDGLPDAVENYQSGSDPALWSTTDNGIPDGWLHRHGFDPTEPGIEGLPAAVPPVEALPGSYGGSWPAEYQWTLADAYSAGRPETWNESVDGPWDNGIDPRDWSRGPDDIPYAWLAFHGLDLDDPSIAGASLSGDGFTVVDNYLIDTDPGVADTDGDGVSDKDENRLYDTDPRRFSTAGTGIADGWSIRFGFDPHDPTLGTTDPAGKGMSLLDVYRFNVEAFDLEAAIQGVGLDPRRPDSAGHGLPDGWLIQNGFDPLDPEIGATNLHNASDFPDVRHLLEDDVPEGLAPIPDLAITVGDAYRHGRPPGWNETSDGPWLGGLDPNVPDQDGDGLPDAVELRGWHARRTADSGGSAPEFYLASSDPQRADTDGDGLDDETEYNGAFEHEGSEYEWTPTDPRNPDTAFSGLDDRDKILGFDAGSGPIDLFEVDEDGVRRPVLDPTVADTDGDRMRDGVEVIYWTGRTGSVGTDYSTLFPGSGHGGHAASWMTLLGCCDETPSEGQAMELLAPLGDLDDDGLANIVDPDADGDGIADGFETSPAALAESGLFPVGGPRAPIDPANPDTDGDGLFDGWEIEHGRFIVAEERWDLDPSLWSSAGESKSDGEANMDDDVVEWWVFPSLDASGEPQMFSYDNQLEHDQKTDPREADENSDGVTEGWVFFWTQRYTIELLQNQTGVVTPGDTVLEDIKGAMLDDPGGVGSLSKFPEPVQYIRFASGSLPPTLDGSRQEAVASGWENGVQVQSPDGGTQVLWKINGTYMHTHADDQAHGLNPYLLDTDGDGLDDDWEVLYTGCFGADPLVPDGGADPDGDGLTNLQEQTHGTSPCLPDSDHGGFGDADEVHGGLDALDPLDDAVTESGDDDGDGVDDLDELARGTNVRLPDTDGDGLLDGRHVLLDPASDQELIASMLSFGIAHEERSDGLFRFYGEGTDGNGVRDIGGGDPTDPSVSGTGIPDGWLFYHYGTVFASTSGADVPPDAEEQYHCNRPAWWDESRLGVWWWGASPERSCTQDMDRDGLDDANGEDPVPAASRDNLNATTASALPAAIEGPSSPTQQRQAAAAWGECAGDPDACHESWGAAPPRWPVRFASVSSTATAPGGDSVINHTEPFWVSGVLEVDHTGCGGCPGVPNRTVVVEAGDPPQTIGVGFTDSEGAFNVTACLCASHSIVIPEDGMVVRSTSTGEVRWSVDLSRFDAGQTTPLSIRAYASSATFWSDPDEDATHPHHTPVTIDGTTHDATEASESDLGDPLVASSTHVELSAPSVVPWKTGRQVELVAVLKDAAQTPVPGQVVELMWAEERRNVTTGPAGQASATFTVLPVDRTGSIPVEAVFAGGPGLGAAVDTGQVSLQAPLEIEASLGQQSIRLGGALDVEVSLQSQGGPASGGVMVRVALGPTVASGFTGPGGEATIRLPVSGIEPGTHMVDVSVPSTAEYARTSLQLPVGVLTGSVLQGQAPDQVVAGQEVSVSGRLTRGDGEALVGAPVEVLLGDDRLDRAVTGTGGNFQSTVRIPDGQPAGLHEIVLHFPGVPGSVDASTVRLPLRVTISTVLLAEDLEASHGDQVSISARLMRQGGGAVAGEPVTVRLDGSVLGRFVSDGAGHVQAPFRVPSDLPYGDHSVMFRFEGSENGTFGPSTSSVFLRLHTSIEITPLHVDALGRGNNLLGGTVTTLFGEPVVGIDVTVTAAGGSFTAKTNAEGGFSDDLVVDDRVPPGNHTVTFLADPQGPYSGAEAESVVPLEVETRIAAHIPSSVGRGTSVQVRLSVLDDRGVRLPEAPLKIVFAESVNESVTTGGGVLNHSMHVPDGLEIGTHVLRVAFPGHGPYLPSDLERPVEVEDGVRILVEKLRDEVRAGDQVPVEVRLEEMNGRPLPNRTLALRYEGGVTVIAQTNETGHALARLPVPEATAGLRLHVTFAGEEGLAPLTVATGTVSVIPAEDSTIWPYILAGLVVSLVVGLVAWRVFTRTTSQGGAAGPLSYGSLKASDAVTAQLIVLMQRINVLIAGTGVAVSKDRTVRDIAQELVDRFGVPDRLAVELVWLVEGTKYGARSAEPVDVRHARDILRTLKQRLPPGGDR